MKTQTILAIAAITVLLATSASLVSWNQTAEAAKAAGVKTNQYGQNTKDIVCGDRLCSEITSEDGTLQVRGGVAAQQQTPQNYNINAIMNRMDTIHEQHQRHMIEMWNSMSYEDRAMMAKNMHHMMDKMSSMSMDDFMSMMGSMHGDKMHGDKKMRDNYHGDKKMHGDQMKGDYHGNKEHKSMHKMMLEGISDEEIRQQIMAEVERHHQVIFGFVDYVEDPALKEKIQEKIQKHKDKSGSSYE